MSDQRIDRDSTEHYSWQIHRIPLANGKYGVVNYFQDISQRVLIQQKVIESEERYHALFNCMDEGYCVVEMLFDAHTRSFAALGGVARRGIYDNMKTAVDKVKKGKVRVVNARFTAMCSRQTK